jgi:hypothetical protein
MGEATRSMGMESSAHQEWRARQKVSWRAIIQTALCAGGVLFIMSGGSPWSTAGTMNAIMGRDLPLGFFTLLVLHLVMSFIYAAVIAHAIYRLRMVMALATGVAVGVLLYGVNYAVFHGLALQMQSPEMRAFLVHVAFGLVASAIYKGASVPPPFRGGPEQVAAATHAQVAVELVSHTDPEPEPVLPGGK